MSLWQERDAGAGPANLRLLRPELRAHLPALTDEALREAVRNKVDQGADRRAISTLIHAFAATSDPQTTGVIYRRPVEDIPQRDRAAFRAALSRVSVSSDA